VERIVPYRQVLQWKVRIVTKSQVLQFRNSGIRCKSLVQGKVREHAQSLQVCRWQIAA